MEFLNKLAAVMFYASLPLLIAFFYSLAAGDGGFVPIGITVLALMFPAIPQILFGIAGNAANLAKSLIKPDTPFNYARIIDVEGMRKRVEVLTLGEVLAITSIAWLAVPAVSVVPYIYYGVEPLDAMFESMSGWTSTGLSALHSVSALPPSIVLFRSITQWIGGLGMAVLILSTFRGKEAISFLKAEGRNQAELGIASTVRLTFNVYIVLTAVGIAALLASGIGPFDAVNLAFSGISNGGFFPFDSFEFTGLQKILLAGLMFAGATSFLFYRSLWQGLPEKALLDEEFIMYLSITAAGILLIVLIDRGEFFNTVLNSISAMATGGFAIGDLAVMHGFAIYLLMLLMLSGGMVGSTTGGLKLWRVLVMVKALALQVKEAFLPRGAVQMVKINGLPINERMIVESATFVFAYLLIFLFSAGLFLAVGHSLQNSLFMTASALGNVGLSTMSVPALGLGGKSLLIILMYVGRIEIFPSLALVAYIMRR